MELVKIKAEKLLNAFKSGNYPVLEDYLHPWKNFMEDNYIICKVMRDEDNRKIADIANAIINYSEYEEEFSYFSDVFDEDEQLYIVENSVIL